MNSTAEISFSLSDVPPEILTQFQQRLQRLQRSTAPQSGVALKVGKEPELPVPEALVKLLLQALQQVAAGKKVVLVETDTEISPEKAAALLHVSRPFLVKQMEGGVIPFHWVGTHRRLRLADVLAYKEQRQARSRETLRQMREEAEDLGLYE
jgi:excisionase family DNA binding protein